MSVAYKALVGIARLTDDVRPKARVIKLCSALGVYLLQVDAHAMKLSSANSEESCSSSQRRATSRGPLNNCASPGGRYFKAGKPD